MSSSVADEKWVIPNEGASLLVGSVLGILASRIECARRGISCCAREAWEVRLALWHGHGWAWAWCGGGTEKKSCDGLLH